MKLIKQIIGEHGLEVTYANNKNIWVKCKNTIICLNIFDLFGLEEDDLMLHIKQHFYRYNIKIDLFVPENNKSNTKTNVKVILKGVDDSVSEKKKNIRNLLTTKYKLLT